MSSTETPTSGVGLPPSKNRPYRTKVARRILTLELAPTTTAFHAHARLVLMAYLYLPHEFECPRLSHNVRKIAAYTGLHTETVKRTRKRLVDLGILVKIGKRPGKNGLMKDVLTWGNVLLDEPPAVARSNEQPPVSRSNEQPAAASREVSSVVMSASGLDGIPAVARSNEPLVVARSDERPAVARRNRRPQVTRSRGRHAPGLQPSALTAEERDGLGTLHRFIRMVANAENAPARILGALQPILDANDPEVVWDLVLRRSPYETGDLALLRRAESLWRSQRLTQEPVGRMAPVVV